MLCRCVDLRTVSYEVPPQEMLSRDSVTVSVDAVCFYKVKILIQLFFEAWEEVLSVVNTDLSLKNIKLTIPNLVYCS